jgi:hypothetical protein
LYASDHKHLLIQGTLGRPNADGFPDVINGNPHGVLDLERDPLTAEADIVEPRNDENQILSQITAAFITFYNDFINHGDSYGQARQLTVDYYQEIVLTDLLPAYAGQREISQYLQFSHGHYHVSTPNFPIASYTPIEFSVGAYRFGHALVRELYHINDINPTQDPDIDDNVAIFDVNHFQSGDLSGGGQLPGPVPSSGAIPSCTSDSICTQPDPAGHQIQWKYFVPALDADPNDPGINFARNTQTTISPALFDLPAETIAGCTDTRPAQCATARAIWSRATSLAATTTVWPPARR